MISVVVPLLNEERSLETLYAEIVAALEQEGHDFEVVFVDDGSTDESLSTLGRLHEEQSNVVVVHLRRADRNLGVHERLRRRRLRPGLSGGRRRGCSPMRVVLPGVA